MSVDTLIKGDDDDDDDDNNNNVVFFLLWDSPASEFYMPTFWNTVCSIFIGRMHKNNNWDKIRWISIQVKVWLKRSLGHSGGGMGRRCVPEYRTGCGGQWPQVEACSKTST
jgi:hypothetical protein